MSDDNQLLEENNASAPETPENASENENADETKETVEGGEKAASIVDNERKSPWFQQRIDKLTAEKYEKAREAEKLRLEKEELRAELEATRQGTKPADNDKNTPKTITQADIDRLAEEKAAAMAAQNRFNEACNNVYNKGAGEFGESEFKKALGTLGAVGVMDSTFLGIVNELPNSHKILHHLGNNPEEAAELSSLSPTKQALALARIDASISTPKPKPVSGAPAPVRAIDGKSKAELSLDDPKLSMDEFMKRRNKQEQERRGYR